MTHPQKHPSDELLIQQLQKEIAELEQRKNQIENELVQFQTHVRSQLEAQLEQVAALTTLYKQHKKAKKEKRLEQKKRGKNYVDQIQIIAPKKGDFSVAANNPETKTALRKLYKEAVFKVHPDTVHDQNKPEEIKLASELTAQLNTIYKSGDLEELSYFYHHVILSRAKKASANSFIHTGFQKDALLQKKKRLVEAIAEIQDSYSYHVLRTYKNPDAFINELKLHFEDKIKKLQKRTRKLR